MSSTSSVNDAGFKRLSRAEKTLTDAVVHNWYDALSTQMISPLGTTFSKLCDIFSAFQRDIDALKAVDEVLWNEAGEPNENV